MYGESTLTSRAIGPGLNNFPDFVFLNDICVFYLSVPLMSKASPALFQTNFKDFYSVDRISISLRSKGQACPLSSVIKMSPSGLKGRCA